MAQIETISVGFSVSYELKTPKGAHWIKPTASLSVRLDPEDLEGTSEEKAERRQAIWDAAYEECQEQVIHELDSYLKLHGVSLFDEKQG